MDFKELHEAAMSGIVPQEIKDEKAKPYEELAYMKLRKYEVAKHNKAMSEAELEAYFQKIRMKYARDMGAHERGERAVEQRNEFMKRIEWTASQYGMYRTREAADKLHNAIYGLEEFWRVPKDDFNTI